MACGGWKPVYQETALSKPWVGHEFIKNGGSGDEPKAGGGTWVYQAAPTVDNVNLCSASESLDNVVF